VYQQYIYFRGDRMSKQIIEVSESKSRRFEGKYEMKVAAEGSEVVVGFNTLAEIQEYLDDVIFKYELKLK